MAQPQAGAAEAQHHRLEQLLHSATSWSWGATAASWLVDLLLNNLLNILQT